MARPIKNNLDYFPHDNSMRNDRKIKALRTKYGLEGYAVYNMILETLCECDLLILKWDETEKELVSGDLNIVSDKLTEVSDYLTKIGLLKRSNGYLFCEQLDKRSETVFGKRTKDLNSLRIENGINISETPVSDKETSLKESESTQSKVKESKVKESKVNIYRKFSHLSITNEENKKLIDLGYNQNQINLIYESIENYSKNNKYKSLFLTAKKWLEKEYGEVKKKDKLLHVTLRMKCGETKEYDVETEDEAMQKYHQYCGAYKEDLDIYEVR